MPRTTYRPVPPLTERSPLASRTRIRVRWIDLILMLVVCAIAAAGVSISLHLLDELASGSVSVNEDPTVQILDGE